MRVPEQSPRDVETAGGTPPPDSARPDRASPPWAVTAGMAAVGVGGVAALSLAVAAASGSLLVALAVAVVLAGASGGVAAWRLQRLVTGLEALVPESQPERSDGSTPSEAPADPLLGDFAEAYREAWQAHGDALARGDRALRHLLARAVEMDAQLDSIETNAYGQEEAVEETASLMANMRASMSAIRERVGELLQSSEESTASLLEIGGSIDEVAGNAATLTEVVEATTASVQQMGASIRQVADTAASVGEMAESSASAVIEMDRSVQEVSAHAVEASNLTDQAHAGAIAGTEAVQATIADIEQIAELSGEAKQCLGGLIERVSEIGRILSAIGEINDETNLLSLNAAIIAAQAGEQGKAFLVVANHVKTLARRTAASTRDIEALIADIESDSSLAAQAMDAGLEAVTAGVGRSRTAGEALATIQEACGAASHRVKEIAFATAEQSRGSKNVAEATQQTSTQIQQISAAMAEQRRASESMRESSARALESCRQVHRSTEEQRTASRSVHDAIATIHEMTRAIGEQTGSHARASEAVAESVMELLGGAQRTRTGVQPIREELCEIVRRAQAARPVDEEADAPRPAGTDGAGSQSSTSSAAASPAR